MALSVCEGRHAGLDGMLDAVARIAARVCEHSRLALAVLRRLRFKGRLRIALALRPVGFPPDVIATCRGVTYRLDVTEIVQWMIYLNIYEEHELDVVLPLIPHGGVCMDVGAHVGFYALHFAQRAGEHGIVHAFEPDPDIFVQLQENIRLNGWRMRIAAHNMAVTNVKDLVPFYPSAGSNSGLGSLHKFKNFAVAQQVGVAAITLDDFLQAHSIDRVDVLKVDVEGSEFELLEGAARSLKTQVFRYVLIEFNGVRLTERGKTLAEFLEIFGRNGYHPIKLNVPLLRLMVQGVVQPEMYVGNLLFAAERP